MLFAKKTAIINVLILRRTLITFRCLYVIIQHFSKEINRRKKKKIIFVKFSFSRRSVPESPSFLQATFPYRTAGSSDGDILPYQSRLPRDFARRLKHSFKTRAETHRAPEYKNLPTGAVPCLSVPFQKNTPKTITR